MARRKRRQTLDVIVWRKVVYRRDGWRCQWPGCGLGPRSFPFRRIEAHHIFTWARYPKLRHKVNNGITLCTTHHAMVTDREDRYIAFFQRLLRKQKKVWTRRQEHASKSDVRKHCLNAVRTVGRRRRRRRSRTGR